jgi:hypothetical protein
MKTAYKILVLRRESFDEQRGTEGEQILLPEFYV